MKDILREGGREGGREKAIFDSEAAPRPHPPRSNPPLSLSEGKNDARITNFHIDSALFGRRRRRRLCSRRRAPSPNLGLQRLGSFLSPPLIISAFSESPPTPFFCTVTLRRGEAGRHDARCPQLLHPIPKPMQCRAKGASVVERSSLFVLKDWPTLSPSSARGPFVGLGDVQFSSALIAPYCTDADANGGGGGDETAAATTRRRRLRNYGLPQRNYAPRCLLTPSPT